ncbi:hypothetical protein IX314_001231 [Fusobacterium sp. DD26]|nr:hypothetical protein [Fusobacterium sp. DD45]MBR8711240.1 hypothetical protein [Fusobacterium sp. DD28]MBR8751767.1 hypothetical protein [Fusobacterium sp. DD26]
MILTIDTIKEILQSGSTVDIPSEYRNYLERDIIITGPRDILGTISGSIRISRYRLIVQQTASIETLFTAVWFTH